MRLRALVALAGLAALAAGGPDETEEAEAFRWFDGLGYPDLAKVPFVRIYEAHWQQCGDDDPEAVPEYGFLLADDGKEFRVFTVGLVTATRAHTRPGTPAHERVGYEKAALDEYVRQGLRRLADPPEDESPWEFEPFGHREYWPQHRFRILVFARACAAQGHADLARELWTLAGKNGGLGGTTLDGMKQEVGWEALRILTIEFGDPDLSWADLLARCVSWKEKFGSSKWIDATIPRLREIVAGGKEPEDPVARLVLRLRDSQGETWYRDDVAEGAGTDLVTTGVAAVPLLLEAWDDLTPSRRVRFGEVWKGYVRPPVDVVAVGDQARAILRAIAGKELSTRAEAEAWFKDVRARGEQAVLADAVAAAGADAPARARLLHERYADAAEAAILTGIARAQDERVRSSLVWELRPVTTERATALLLDELRDQEMHRRVDAAWLLLLRGRDEGIDAVAASWHNAKDAESAAELLAACGKSSAIRALEAGFLAKPVDERLDVVAFFIFGRGWGRVPEKELPPPDADWPQAVESLLVEALADEEECRGMSASWNQYSFSDPRVCDVGACALKEKFGDRYDFDHRGSRSRKNAQIVEFRNRWRQARDLPLLPVPKDPRPAPLPAGVEADLRERFLADLDPAPVEECGIASLPAVTRWLADTAKDHPARPALEALRRRLACRVFLIEAPDEARAAVEGLEERPLTAEAFVGVAVSLANALPQGATGFSLSAQRDEEGGVTVRVVLERGNGKPGSGWDYGTRLRAGRRELRNSSGTCTDERGRSRECWEDLEKRLSGVLAGDPSVPFEANLSTALEE